MNDKELANEILRLEKRVDTLTYLLDMRIMVAVRKPGDAEALVGAAVVASATDKISDAAADIAAQVLHDIGIHPIVREAFGKVEERICCIKAKPKSALTGKRSDELELAKTGVNIIAIRRKNEWIVNPRSEEQIEDEDSLIVRGTPGGINDLRTHAESSFKKEQ